MKGIWFHIVGITCIIWFLIRVVPAPHRYQYPCQQMSITVAMGYVAFWSLIFTGLTHWVKQVKHKTTGVIPAIVVCFILIFSISGMVFANNYSVGVNNTFDWDPIPKEPIGTPFGAFPGRVVWVWNPDATEKNLEGFWWETQNNDQDAIDEMYSQGLQGFSSVPDDFKSWEAVFQYFNEVHGKGKIGYQPGEKIAIKINMNNGYYNEYDYKLKDIDANPYVVKGLLRQLINVVGVAQEDIVVFDASRKLMNWFYNRVYYETYPADPLVPEFPNVHFLDSTGGAEGRQQVVASNEKVYFAEGECTYRTLPTCVTEAEYLINMPIVKRHVADRVTLAGKNWFGAWVEDVVSIHEYHTIGYTAMGNPAPQVDLLAHEELGGKTLLLIGDGTYCSRYNNAPISHFQMYPFNDDYMNSLFFSQDAVALDSVMYDFLYADGTGPSERAQNYIHQAAQPNADTYDPEGEGIFLSESLGVHEHWDTSYMIFSSQRYSGLDNDGIDYIAIGEEHASPSISIMQPREKTLYLFGKNMKYMLNVEHAVLIGKINVQTQINGMTDTVEKVEFYIDEQLQSTDSEEPYEWLWNQPSFSRHILKVISYAFSGNTTTDELVVWKIF